MGEPVQKFEGEGDDKAKKKSGEAAAPEGGGADADYSDDETERKEEYTEGGYHPVSVGDVFNSRYVVVKKLGWGHFSTVWMARDMRFRQFKGSPEYVALKIQKSARHYTDAARDEIELLRCVADASEHVARSLGVREAVFLRGKSHGGYAPDNDNEGEGLDDVDTKQQDGPGAGSPADNPDADPDATMSSETTKGFNPHAVRLLDSFDHEGPHGRHVCMVFEPLGPNLLHVIKRYKYKGMPTPIVKRIAKQACAGLDFLHRHCNIIHTDIKPENILVTRAPPRPAESELPPTAIGDGRSGVNADIVRQQVIENIEQQLEGRLMENLTAEQRRKLKKKLKKKKQQQRKAASKQTEGSSANGDGDGNGVGGGDAGGDVKPGAAYSSSSSSTLAASAPHSNATGNATEAESVATTTDADDASAASTTTEPTTTTTTTTTTNNNNNNNNNSGSHNATGAADPASSATSTVTSLSPTPSAASTTGPTAVGVDDAEDKDAGASASSASETDQMGAQASEAPLSVATAADTKDGGQATQDQERTAASSSTAQQQPQQRQRKVVSLTRTQFAHLNFDVNDLYPDPDESVLSCDGATDDKFPERVDPRDWMLPMDRFFPTICASFGLRKMIRALGAPHAVPDIVAELRGELDADIAAALEQQAKECGFIPRTERPPPPPQEESSPQQQQQQLQAPPIHAFDGQFDVPASLSVDEALAAVDRAHAAPDLRIRDALVAVWMRAEWCFRIPKSMFDLEDDEDEDVDPEAGAEATNAAGLLGPMEGESKGPGSDAAVRAQARREAAQELMSKSVVVISAQGVDQEETHSFVRHCLVHTHTGGTSRHIAATTPHTGGSGALANRPPGMINGGASEAGGPAEAFPVSADAPTTTGDMQAKATDAGEGGGDNDAAVQEVAAAEEEDFSEPAVLFRIDHSALGTEHVIAYLEQRARNLKFMVNYDSGLVGENESELFDVMRPKCAHIMAAEEGAACIMGVDMARCLHGLGTAFTDNAMARFRGLQARMRFFIGHTMEFFDAVEGDIIAFTEESTREAERERDDDDDDTGGDGAGRGDDGDANGGRGNRDEDEARRKRRRDFANLRRELNKEYADVNVKIADLGNACWTDKHFTDDIQTRQYRSPEVLLGSEYNTTTDMWSMGCTIFELLTGDMLFSPQAGNGFDRNEDHLALMMELVGEFSEHVKHSGRFSQSYFSSDGRLRHIRHLKFWPLRDVLIEKYDVEPQDAEAISDFLLPMLHPDPERRASAAECLCHPWLEDTEVDGIYDMPNPRDVLQQMQQADEALQRRAQLHHDLELVERMLEGPVGAGDGSAGDGSGTGGGEAPFPGLEHMAGLGLDEEQAAEAYAAALARWTAERKLDDDPDHDLDDPRAALLRAEAAHMYTEEDEAAAYAQTLYALNEAQKQGTLTPAQQQLLYRDQQWRQHEQTAARVGEGRPAPTGQDGEEGGGEGEDMYIDGYASDNMLRRVPSDDPEGLTLHQWTDHSRERRHAEVVWEAAGRPVSDLYVSQSVPSSARAPDDDYARYGDEDDAYDGGGEEIHASAGANGDDTAGGLDADNGERRDQRRQDLL